jgi:hypothetical protein
MEEVWEGAICFFKQWEAICGRGGEGSRSKISWPKKSGEGVATGAMPVGRVVERVTNAE